jgi:hypothetical protein
LKQRKAIDGAIRNAVEGLKKKIHDSNLKAYGKMKKPPFPILIDTLLQMSGVQIPSPPPLTPYYFNTLHSRKTVTRPSLRKPIHHFITTIFLA